MAEPAVMRAEAEWQRAGAYSVRIQGMNRQHHISLRDEFDEHDSDGTKYIVLLDDGYPVATCRFYETSPGTVVLGRVVVLPEYRGQHLGRRMIEYVIEYARQELRPVDLFLTSRPQRVAANALYQSLGFRQKMTNVYLMEVKR